jgi:HK97 family phage major capsid protein
MLGRPDHRIGDIIDKAGVPSLDLSDSPLAESVLTTFAGSLARASAFEAMLPFMTPAPLRTTIGFLSAQATGTDTAEAAPKPQTTFTIGGQALTPSKAIAFVVASDELMRLALQAGAELFERELARAIGRSQDGTLVDVLSAGASSTASSGDPLTDLAGALAAISDNSAAAYFWLVHPRQVKQLATFSVDGMPAFPGMSASMGGDIAGVQVTPCDALDIATAGSTSILVAGIEPAALDVARHAALQMDDDPSAGAQSLVSLWQSNLSAIRLERAFAVARLRTDAVHVLTDCDYPAPA